MPLGIFEYSENAGLGVSVGLGVPVGTAEGVNDGCEVAVQAPVDVTGCIAVSDAVAKLGTAGPVAVVEALLQATATMITIKAKRVAGRDLSIALDGLVYPLIRCPIR